MPGIEDKILAEDRESDGFAGFAKVLQRAVKKFFLREDGKRSGASGIQGTRQGDGIEGFAQNAARWRSGLEFGDDIKRLARESGGEVAQGRGCFCAVPERGFRQNAFAMID